MKVNKEEKKVFECNVENYFKSPISLKSANKNNIDNKAIIKVNNMDEFLNFSTINIKRNASKISNQKKSNV